MGEQHAWMFLFMIVVPILFVVTKLAVGQKSRHEDLSRRLDLLENKLDR